MGEDVARCPSCSLHLHVVFDPGEVFGARESEREREQIFSFSIFFDLALTPFLPFLLLFKTKTIADFAEFLPGATKQASEVAVVSVA